MDRYNELCTKKITGECALCETLAEHDQFLPFWLGGGLFRAGIQGISKSTSRGWKRLANKGKIPRRWWCPSLQYQSLLFNLSNEEWKRQHDETSRTIFQVLVAIVTFSFFCLLSLSTPDVSLLASNATIKFPFANTDISFVAFLFIGPVILIALTTYLHIFVGYHSILSTSPHNGRGLPHVFNLQSRLARYVSNMLLYWLAPCVLLAFSYKGAPRPGGSLLVIVTVAVTIVLVWVKIQRWPSGQRRNVYRSLWLIEVVLVCILIRQLGNSSSLLARPLYLFRANLENQELVAINLQGADLIKANLKGVHLYGAHLGSADLQGANLYAAVLWGTSLEGANLYEANLQYAWFYKDVKLQGAIFWNAELQSSYLQKVEFQNVDLEGAKLQGANLRGADLTGAKHLTQDQIDRACIDEATKLPQGLTRPTPCPTNP